VDLASVAEPEKVLGCPVYGELPNCSDELAEAYSDRQFLDEGLVLRQSVGTIAAKCLGFDVPPSRGERAVSFSKVETSSASWNGG